MPKSDDDYYVSDNDSDFEVDGAAEEGEVAAEQDRVEEVQSDAESSVGSDLSDEEDVDLEVTSVADEVLDLSEEEEEIDLQSVSKFNSEIIIIKPENRRTSNVMSRYEMTELTSIRATQIAEHGNCLVDITGLDDPILMAKRELMQLKCPLVLRREIGKIKDKKTGDEKIYIEYWYPNEMTFAVHWEV